MRIALISRPRTCSTAISKSLANFYNLDYLGESYFNIHNTLLRYYKLRRNYDTQLALQKFSTQLNDYTNKIFQKENFIIKIFPSILHFPPSNMMEEHSFDFVKNQFLFKLDVLKIKQYDKIYFLDRVLSDSLLSWAYCHHTRYFHKKKSEPPKYIKIEINDHDLSAVKFYIIEYFLQQKIKKYLDTEKIPYTYINESNCESYIDKNYLDIENTIIDYKDYILNLKKFDNFVEKWCSVCEQETQNWNFF